MKPGIHALFSLDGAPLAPDEEAVLSLAEGEPALRAQGEAFAVRVCDVQREAGDLQRTAGGLLAFAGFLDEREELAAELGVNGAWGPARLAACALARFGGEAPAKLLGEWQFLRWDAPARELTLMTSETLRDPFFFALEGGLLALSSDPLRLAGLPRVGLALDRAGYALGHGRAALRQVRTEETIWRGIRLMRPAAVETFRHGHRQSLRVTRPEQFERWTGTFEEAAEALEHTGRRIVAQHMGRNRRTAFHLSGGLDSTLLTSWGAYERGPGREMFCISSVAPPGSRLPDERRFLYDAAASLQVPVRECWPAGEGNLFRPSPEVFALSAAPVNGPFLTHQALERAALEGGAGTVLSGAMGEMHVSGGFDLVETRSWLRLRLAALRDAYAERRARSGWPADAFAVRFSEEFLAGLPRAWARAWRKGPPKQKPGRGADAPIGISPMWYKNAGGGTSLTQELRQCYPYRDQRLMRLAARMPASFLRHGGMTRPFARHLLQGRVSDAIRQREHGRAFSPDFVPTLKRQAAEARSRIPLYCDAGVDRWLDVAWLDASLLRLERMTGQRDLELVYSAQMTAVSGEFLLWAVKRGIRL